MNDTITPHFSWREFACHTGEPVPDELRPMVWRLCNSVLEPIRLHWGGPIVIISGYRTPAYNARLARQSSGVAQKSQHMLGTAADIRPDDVRTLPTFLALVEAMIKNGDLPTLGGLGSYPQWIHVDIRARPTDGHIARWLGAGFGSEPA